MGYVGIWHDMEVLWHQHVAEGHHTGTLEQFDLRSKLFYYLAKSRSLLFLLQI